MAARRPLAGRAFRITRQGRVGAKCRKSIHPIRCPPLSRSPAKGKAILPAILPDRVARTEQLQVKQLEVVWGTLDSRVWRLGFKALTHSVPWARLEPSSPLVNKVGE